MMPVEAVAPLGVSMTRSHNRLFCRLDGLNYQQREQERVLTLKNLGLLETEIVPVFDEATQSAAEYLETPICILTLMVEEEVWFKSAVGLSKLGLMNQLAARRKMPRQDSFSSYVVDSANNVVIDDALNDELFTFVPLVQLYGIRAYLGTPLMTGSGQCIGALEVMDLAPRSFTIKDAQFLDLTARWCLREYEQSYLHKNQLKLIHSTTTRVEATPEKLEDETNLNSVTSMIKTKLLKQLSENLVTPLTSVVGMASVLRQEMYGPLTLKQKEYLEIIHNSGQNMISLVEEIINIGFSDDNISPLDLTPVDVELLIQQVINSIHPIAQRQNLKLRLLPVDLPGRFWLLDKEKVRQSLYYLLISLAQTNDSLGDLSIQIQTENDSLDIAIWLSHSFFATTYPISSYSKSLTSFIINGAITPGQKVNNFQIYQKDLVLKEHILKLLDHQLGASKQKSSKKKGATAISNGSEIIDSYYCPLLELLFSCYIAENHGGKLALRRTSSGYRYILKLPKTEKVNNS